MISPDTLARVGATAMAITSAAEHVDQLIRLEPVQQPPTHRRVQLVSIARDLERLRGRLETLWS